jgi:hypothetical protein
VAGGKVLLHAWPALPAMYPRRGGWGEEGKEVRAGGIVDRLVCWGPALLLPTPTPGRGVAVCQGGARV